MEMERTEKAQFDPEGRKEDEPDKREDGRRNVGDRLGRGRRKKQRRKKKNNGDRERLQHIQTQQTNARRRSALGGRSVRQRERTGERKKEDSPLTRGKECQLSRT